jgi:hypothetical protein
VTAIQIVEAILENLSAYIISIIIIIYIVLLSVPAKKAAKGGKITIAPRLLDLTTVLKHSCPGS